MIYRMALPHSFGLVGLEKGFLGIYGLPLLQQSNILLLQLMTMHPYVLQSELRDIDPSLNNLITRLGSET